MLPFSSPSLKKLEVQISVAQLSYPLFEG